MCIKRSTCDHLFPSLHFYSSYKVEYRHPGYKRTGKGIRKCKTIDIAKVS